MKCEYKVHTEHSDTLYSDIFNIVFAVAFVAFDAFIAAVVAHVNVSKMFSFVSNKTRQQTVRNVSRPSPLLAVRVLASSHGRKKQFKL